MFGAILKATNSSFQKGMTFCRSIYVKKVMELLAFIFEQPSYTHLYENELRLIFQYLLGDISFCYQLFNVSNIACRSLHFLLEKNLSHDILHVMAQIFFLAKNEMLHFHMDILGRACAASWKA